MTTIRLSKIHLPTLTLYGSKVQEMLNKEVGSWPKEFFAPADLPITPTGTKPIKQSMDFLNVTREWTITATLDGNSIGSGNALDARDTLVSMVRSGGTIDFIYGLPTDISPGTAGGYGPDPDNVYYTGVAFTVHIRRIMVDELPKGGSGSETGNAYTGNATKGAPEQFLVTITLFHAEDLTA